MTATDPESYDAFAPIYDEWQERYGAFWRVVLPRLELELARMPDASAFLELGCGTGALLGALRAQHPGWRLTGVDASAAMLARARLRRGVGWLRARFDRLPIADGSFAAVGAFFDSVNHAAAPGELESLCSAAARALRPGGRFVFDVNNELGFRTWWQSRRVYATARWTLTMEASFDARARLAHGRAMVQIGGGGRPRITEVTERCFSDEELHAALTGAGFRVETAEPWSPMAEDLPGKTWVVAVRS